MSKQAIAAYQTAPVLSADGVTLTTMLYDGAIKAIKKARIHWEAQNLTGYADEVQRALLIVGELYTSLDMQYGELPERMGAIYTYCMGRLVDASTGAVEKLDEVELHIGRIAEAWKAAAASLRADQPSRLSAGGAAA
jgi:flagellar protein FliS